MLPSLYGFQLFVIVEKGEDISVEYYATLRLRYFLIVSRIWS